MKSEVSIVFSEWHKTYREEEIIELKTVYKHRSSMTI